MNNTQIAKQWIAGADALLIGASNGLSIAEGYHIFANNEMFRTQFARQIERFGIGNVVEGFYYPYPTQADRQEFFDTLNLHWVEQYQPSQVMRDLLRVVGGKDYFVITSNCDTHLELSGFDASRIWELEGTFGGMLEDVADKNKQFHDFLAKYQGKNLVVLELGIGMRNRMIKLPLMQLVAANPNMRYVTLNMPQELLIPQEIAAQSVGLAGDIAATLQQLI